jgi:hypothetical protein
MQKPSTIKTDKTVSQTLADLRRLFRKQGIEDWEPLPAEQGPGYTVRYYRDRSWTEIGSFYQPTKGTNIRQCYQVIDNMFRWEARGITGLIRTKGEGQAFMGGELVATTKPQAESFDEACAIIGVEPDAPIEEVRKIYQIKVQRFHPDHGGDPERFKRLQKAFELIEKVKGSKAK